MNFFHTIDTYLHKLVRILHGISNVAVCVMILCITIDVFGRFFFNQPLVGAFEMTELGLAIVVFFSLSMTHLYDEHISIDFAVVRLPEKFQHALKAFVESSLLLILVLMIYQTLSYGMRLYERGTTTSDLLLPIYPFLYCIAFAALIFSLLVLSNICKSILQAVSSS